MRKIDESKGWAKLQVEPFSWSCFLRKVYSWIPWCFVVETAVDLTDQRWKETPSTLSASHSDAVCPPSLTSGSSQRNDSMKKDIGCRPFRSENRRQFSHLIRFVRSGRLRSSTAPICPGEETQRTTTTKRKRSVKGAVAPEKRLIIEDARVGVIGGAARRIGWSRR